MYLQFFSKFRGAKHFVLFAKCHYDDLMKEDGIGRIRSRYGETIWET
jgi:hypothetical protein